MLDRIRDSLLCNPWRQQRQLYLHQISRVHRLAQNRRIPMAVLFQLRLCCNYAQAGNHAAAESLLEGIARTLETLPARTSDEAHDAA
jgi:hypothetical protein